MPRRWACRPRLTSPICEPLFHPDFYMNLAALRSQLRGQILVPGCAGYDSARRLWNAMIDRRPAAILRCTGAKDVAAAVRFAASEDLYPAIRAGGHNVAGLASIDEG